MANDRVPDRREWSASQVKTHFEAILAERDRLFIERAAHLADRMHDQQRAFSDHIALQIAQVGQQIDAVSVASTLALDSARIATSKSEAAIEKRFDAVNEFREQLSDERGSLMRQDVADRTFTGIDQRMQRLEAFQAKLLGAFGLAVLFVPILTGLIVFLINRKS